MKLYANARCESGQPYIVDWLAVTLENEDEIVFDVQGEQDVYGSIKTRSKDLVPWVQRHDGDETEIDEDFSDKKIFEMIRTGSNHRVGFYPLEGSAYAIMKAENDKFTDCHGVIYDGGEEFKFVFEAEANV